MAVLILNLDAYPCPRAGRRFPTFWLPEFEGTEVYLGPAVDKKADEIVLRHDYLTCRTG